jgi:carbon-monoxide dehydrogenase large subunit
VSGAARAEAEHGKPGQGIGARVPRKEDARHLRGRGSFVPDMILPGQLEVAFLRSPVAHGRIRGITKPEGREAEVFVAADLEGLSPILTPSTLAGYRAPAQPILAQGKLRFVGEPVALCIAESRALAEDLAEQILLDYEELPAVVDMDAALANPAVRVHDDWPDNIFVSLAADSGFEERARGAPVVVVREMSMSRQAMVPMEGKAVLAHWDDRANQLVVYSSTQVPHVIRAGLCAFLHLPHHLVRVVSPDVGGGFGYKCQLQPEELAVAWLALKFRRPFRYVEDRREHLIAGANCREHRYKLTAYADERGRLLALDAEAVVDGGAYSAWPFTVAVEPAQVVGNLPGPYDLLGYRCRTHCVATNKPGLLPYRGVARTGVCFAIELAMDAVARAVGREPWEVRYENLVPPGAMPHNNITRKHFDSGDFPGSLLLAKEKIGLEAIRERQRRGEPDGRRVGVGFAIYCEQSAHGTSVYAAWGVPVIPGYEQATVRTTPDGGLELRVGIHSHGQGLETTLAQVAHEILGVEVARIQVVHGDTGVTPFSVGTFASRSMVMAGGAVAEACEALVPRFVRIGAHLLQCRPEEARFEPGRVIGPSGGSVTIEEIAQSWYVRPQSLPADVDRTGLEATVGFQPKVDSGVFSYATHAALVAVDTELGHVEILDYVIVEDCGTVVNPMVVEGQTYGGAAQGIGTALFEEVQYDANGQPNASTFADYLLPGPTELPAFRLFHMETPSPYTRFGIKGMGEGGAIAPPAAICNGVNDALRDLGVEVHETPLTPRRLLEAIEAARGAAAASAPA